VNCTETAEPIEVPVGGLTHVGPDEVKIGRIHSPPRGVTRRRCADAGPCQITSDINVCEMMLCRTVSPLIGGDDVA